MSAHICPQCLSVYTSAIAASFCCDESAYGDDD